MAARHTPNGERAGILFIISAPSGAGKTTLVNAVTGEDAAIRVSVSHTTRAARPGETDGVAYHFVDGTEFTRLVTAGAFLEHACVFDHHYGTARQWVHDTLATGTDVILEIDWQGARQVRASVPGTISIFILPPSLAALEERLRARGDGVAGIGARMKQARDEISHYAEYDYLLFNDVLGDAVRDLRAIIRASRRRYALHRDQYDARVSALLRSPGNFQ